MADKEACPRIEQWPVITFLVDGGCKAVEINSRTSTVYGATCFSRKNVSKWAKLLKEGRRSVEDEDRPGRPTEVRSPEVIKSINDHIQSNSRVTVDDKARTLSLSVGKALLLHPPYSPDLAPSDFHLFGLLKEFMRGTKFENDDEVKML